MKRLLRYYAGIGSRETPIEILWLMSQLGFYFQESGYTLRSGGARGADAAFEESVTDNRKEIFLPWRRFNNHSSRCWHIPDEAFRVASDFHPGWKYLKDPVKRLMARNTQQILGWDLGNPSQFVICWTPDGADGTSIPTTKRTGGTGQAIRIAASYNIPVINLFHVHQSTKAQVLLLGGTIDGFIQNR